MSKLRVAEANTCRSPACNRSAEVNSQAPSDPAIDYEPRSPLNQPIEDALSPTDLRCLRQSEAFRIAWALQNSASIQERITVYKSTNRSLLYLAAALWPELMPELNGDLEWRALLSADLS